MDFFTQLLDFLKSYGAPVILLWSLVETDLVFLVVGAIASSGAINPVVGFLAAIVGALTHDSCVFWLAKNRAAWVRSKASYQKFSASVEKLANKTGPWQLALCRPLYGTRYPAVIYWGLRDLPYPRFLGFTLAGLLPWTLLLATIGFQLSGHIDQFDDWLKEAKNVIFGAVLTVAAVLYLRHRLTRKPPASVEPASPSLLPQLSPKATTTDTPPQGVVSPVPPETAHRSARPS
jgi:membrane protein DedA with SNARE-associated domain